MINLNSNPCFALVINSCYLLQKAKWGNRLTDINNTFFVSDIDECASAPCQNGGSCVDLDDAFSCQCPPAWEGNVCQFGNIIYIP